MYMHAYTLYSAVRPFGCSVAMGSYDEFDGPQLFSIDPSGVSYVYTFGFKLIVIPQHNLTVYLTGLLRLLHG